MAEERYQKPITELSNSLTNFIDVATTQEIVEILHGADKEIFDGWDGSNGVFDDTIEVVLREIQKILALWDIEKGGYSIILSGCGTSGRLAFMISSYFNQIRQGKGQFACYDYLIAGGDKALFTSQEAPEDNPHAGREDFIKVDRATDGKDRVLYIGITCGLSAAYVAGQLDYCMDNPDRYIPVLVGFNPTYLAKKNRIENWDKTFYTVASRLESLVNVGIGFIINPIIGPEPITGSTRMKSGSATKILLETLFLGIEGPAGSTSKPAETLQSYQMVQSCTYSKSIELAQCIEIVGESLMRDGHVFYLGQNRLGIVGMIDASECPPTYGAAFEDIRGFVGQGYNTLCNKEGPLEHFVKISLDHFNEVILPTLTEKDTVICLVQGEWIQLGPELSKSSAKKIAINIGKPICNDTFKKFTNICDVSLNMKPFSGFLENMDSQISVMLEPLLQEMSCKWMCNVISTGAHVKKGKVFENTMVDVRVSNNKLYYRAIGIIQKYSKTTADEAESFLLRSIYKRDDIDLDIRALPVSAHIEEATGHEKVVPIAILIAISGCTYDSACEELAQIPIIRNAINKFIS